MWNVGRQARDPGSKIRVLIVDDSVVMRKILSDTMRQDPDIEVVGTASNGLIALQRMAQMAPDLVTLDIEMPEMDGISTLKEIRRQYPRTRVIMCSTLTERGASITMTALAAGADDYLAKHAATAPGGTAAFHDQLLPKVKQFFASAPAATPAPNGHPVPAVRPTSAPPSPRPRIGQPRAVAIGVSTGGPNALAEIIPMFPGSFPLPILIVQHMPPMFTRLLAERLQSHSPLKVVEARDGMTVTGGTVYIAPGDYHMVVTKKGTEVVIRLNQEAMENSCRPAVDVLFRSVGEVYGGATVSAILTGMGQDGLRGVETLRHLGGYVIAQDEASSVVWGMPGFVARAGLADTVCDLKAVPGEIMRHVRMN
jgi:two-component system, chemotaxis family, protein-glutamate methylesterase/glutaminase